MTTLADPPRFLSEAMSAALINEIRSAGKGRARTQISLISNSWADIRWARNQPYVAGDDRNVIVSLTRQLPEGAGSALTNQVDPGSLASAVQWAERMLRLNEQNTVPWFPTIRRPRHQYPATAIWSEGTYSQTPETRSAIAAQLIRGAQQSGMLSTGYIAVNARGTTLSIQEDDVLYAPQTLTECSLTVRDPQGTGSGWAGRSSYDWNRLDAAKLAEVALDKCLRSRNPVAIEPGRYTLIMEPQATFDLFAVIMRTPIPNYMSRAANEWDDDKLLPFKSLRTKTYSIGWKGDTRRIRFTRIGERVLDQRISISYDPLDPDLGVVPFDNQGEPYVPVLWFDQGVLTTLFYDQDYAMNIMRREEACPNSGAFRVHGGTDSVDDMIRTTQRGLLVTRFVNVGLVDGPSMLCTGMTRDGLWLIEGGKVSHPVKNLRFTESPMFAFNNVEQIGPSVPVYTPGLPAVVPAMKVRDFSFTSLVNAV